VQLSDVEDGSATALPSTTAELRADPAMHRRWTQFNTRALTDFTLHLAERMRAPGRFMAVPTAVSGIFGMNFERMPGLGAAYGFEVTMAVMGAGVVALFLTFRKTGWI
jgi:hypothetical protein